MCLAEFREEMAILLQETRFLAHQGGFWPKSLTAAMQVCQAMAAGNFCKSSKHHNCNCAGHVVDSMPHQLREGASRHSFATKLNLESISSGVILHWKDPGTSGNPQGCYECILHNAQSLREGQAQKGPA